MSINANIYSEIDSTFLLDEQEEIKTFNYLKSENSDDILQMYLKIHLFHAILCSFLY
mgnify:CR=1 FL=1